MRSTRRQFKRAWNDKACWSTIKIECFNCQHYTYVDFWHLFTLTLLFKLILIHTILAKTANRRTEQQACPSLFSQWHYLSLIIATSLVPWHQMRVHLRNPSTRRWPQVVKVHSFLDLFSILPFQWRVYSFVKLWKRYGSAESKSFR